MRATLPWLLAGMLGACSPPLPLARFADTAPAFDPVAFFTGHTQSWGVVENCDGRPSDIVTTDCVGKPDGADGLRMVQHLTVGSEAPQTRTWHMRRLDPHHFEATANDLVGTARGEAEGRVFHWTWVLATKPGQGWRNVVFEQWMYHEDGGAMVNRSVIRKLGITLAEVTEQFRHVP